MESFIVNRIVLKVNRFLVFSSLKVLPHFFCNEWNKWSCNFCKCLKCCIQCFVSFCLVTIIFTLPETSSRTTNIPVIELINKVNNWIDSCRKIILFHSFCNFLYKRLCYRQKPAVKWIFRKLVVKCMTCTSYTVYVCICYKE